MNAEPQWHLLEAMPDAVILVRSDTLIVQANSNAEKLFGDA